MPRNALLSGLPAAPSHFDRPAKRLYRDVLIAEIRWKGAINHADLLVIIDFVDAESRLEALRQMLADELKKTGEDHDRGSLVLALNRQIDAAVRMRRFLSSGLHLELISHRDRASCPVDEEYEETDDQ